MPHLIAVFGKFTDVMIVLVANAIDVLENLALHAVRLRIACRPLGHVIVFGLHDVVEGRDLHVAVQRHHFALTKYLVDLA